MNREKNVIDFYILCNKLKDVIRTGWQCWDVQRERVESVAEHIYGTQMLAIAIWSEYQCNIDLMKVLFMLAVHEMEEILIGDLTPFQISKTEKIEKGHNAVVAVLKNLAQHETIEQLIFEFDECKTAEARFANQCDKLECDIQCKLYDNEACVDLNSKKVQEIRQIDAIDSLLQDNSWSSAWIKFHQNEFVDEPFKTLSQHLIDENF